MQTLFTKQVLITLFILIVTGSHHVKAQQPVIGYQQIVGGLSNPVDVVNAGDSRLFIVQQNGLIRLWNGSSLSTFIDLSAIITNPSGGEQGLLSLAFHPGYNVNGYFFVWYSSTTGAVTLARYKRDIADLNVGDPGTGQVLLSIPKPGTPYFTNHNGGKLNFGSDGMLYIGTGDGGSGGDPFNNAQNGNSLLGKMLRLDVNGFATSAPYYDIPADNPFLAPGDGILDEIYALGLRNPWRWSFDRLTGDMWIGDVGQGLYEEVNFRLAANAAAVNYGWRCREGMHDYNTAGCTGAYTDPIFEYPHDITTGGYSITGGYVYRGSEYPSLYDYYVTADYVSGNLWLIKPSGAGSNSIRQGGLANNISGFGEGTDGTLYALRRTSPDGILYKVTVTSVIPVRFTDCSARQYAGYNEIKWIVGSAQGVEKYIIEFSTSGANFSPIAEITAAGNSNREEYSYRHAISVTGKCFYRVAAVDRDGVTLYSPVTYILAVYNSSIRIYPTLVSDRRVTVESQQPANKLQLFSMEGKLVYEKKIEGSLGVNTLYLPAVARGMYILQVSSAGFIKREQLLIR